MLARHAAIRRVGDPVPTVLVGEPEQTRTTIEALLGVTVVDAPKGVEQIAAHVLQHARDGGCIDQLLTAAAVALGEQGSHLRARWPRLGDAEKRALVDALRDVAARELADTLVAEDDTLHQGAPTSNLDRLARLARIDAVSLPPFAIRVTDRDAAVVAAAVTIAERAPRLPLVLAMTPARLDAALREHGGTRIEVLLRQGTVVLRRAAEPHASPTLASMPAVAEEAGAVGSTASAIERTRAELAVNPEDPELRELARSLAERVLHDALQARPTTRGRFALNREMAFRFGPRACEIDLCDHETRIAVEIDGYHHFTSHDAYRRDRRKDVLLQREGFVVLRFLDCDVFDRLEFVLQVIEDVLYHRSTTGL